ncbi:MAG: TIGR03792 family protein [Cyanobacteriota bacterium]|nr:TIGR03792 family protein [Cyanobacteriota bacterium]
MVIEWLKIQVRPRMREKFVQLDYEIWTKMLEGRSGFLGKEVWLDSEADDLVILVIRWQTFEDWQSVPDSILERTDREFKRKMGRQTFRYLDSHAYQARKFSQI